MADLEAAKLKRDNYVSPDEKVVDRAAELRAKLRNSEASRNKAKDRLVELKLQQQDSRLFLEELKRRVKHLEESQVAREILDGLEFSVCPACLSEIDGVARGEHCHLCKHALPKQDTSSNLLRMKNELAIQTKESSHLMSSRDAEIGELDRELPRLDSEVKRLESEYLSIAFSWSTEAELAIEDAARNVGSLTEALKQAHEQQALAGAVTALQKQRDELASEQATLNVVIDDLLARQEKRKIAVASAIEDELIRLLKLDLPRQEEFIHAREVRFEFADNNVLVNGVRNFSESSAVVLRHLFHLALLGVSTRDSQMRVPRFIMLDGVDDGGLEPERSRRLQSIIADESASYLVEHQIIFATSKPRGDDGLHSANEVGRYFTQHSRALNTADI
ncbi:hypothetical protein DFR29_104404 [Tahibacter aquaticus]|uniref:AAA domain-containing protein n=1 Tax=Tahibacter aquaticus TaxID=520092 RepID=A0A4R6Z2W9_9GAMM|nr:AAA family ATPase [Tahibacter aquaticus]TDR45967.1 hypothetical protein DFR29_104404 [Tahibacter aquaticus]